MRQTQGLIASTLVAVALASCSGTLQPRGDQGSQATSSNAAAAEHRQAAEAFERTASKSQGAARDELLFRAAEEWFASGDPRRAQRSLEAASALPAPGTSPVLQVVSARIELERGAPQRALDRVLKLPQPLASGIAPDALEIEGRARFALGDGGGAVAALVARERYLSDSNAVRTNERIIWDGLQRPGLSLRPPAGADTTTRGWLELASIVVGHDTSMVKPALMAWRDRYPKHPANGTLLPTWLADTRPSGRSPHRIALLLPLSGRLEPAAAAVRDGFLTAYFGSSGDAGTPPEIVVFDTEQLGAESAYDAAVRAGSDFVVGPLAKTEVGRLAVLQHSVPVLALNTIGDRERATGGFYQFALAPEEEAEQTAMRALADGHTKALALVSGDDFGRRLLDSFTRAFQQGGGHIVATEAYDPSANDHQAEIKRLLALDLAQSRYNALVAILGEKLEFEPHPRQDADVLFLGSQAAQARLLRPELRFHFYEDIPIYATSSIYEPQPRANEDLDGIVFPDMPWMITPSADDPLRLALRELGADEWQRRGRLYALGYDACRLVPLLYGSRGERTQFAGMTGLLTVEADGHVRRELTFARLHNGVAEPLGASVATVGTDQVEPAAQP